MYIYLYQLTPQVAGTLHQLVETLDVLEKLVVVAAAYLVAVDQVAVGVHQLHVVALHALSFVLFCFVYIFNERGRIR